MIPPACSTHLRSFLDLTITPHMDPLLCINLTVRSEVQVCNTGKREVELSHSCMALEQS